MIADLMNSDPAALVILAAGLWLVLAVTSVRRARKGGDS